jgi:hypothetical protein
LLVRELRTKNFKFQLAQVAWEGRRWLVIAELLPAVDESVWPEFGMWLEQGSQILY